MPKIAGLVKRGNTYYVRVRVPKDVQSHFKSKEVNRTLGTTDFKTASQVIHTVRAGIEAEFEKARKVKKAKETGEDMLAGYSDHQLTALALKWLNDMRAKKETRRADDTGEWTQERLRDYRQELHEEELVAREETLGISQRDSHEGSTTASRFLETEGISYSRNTKQFRELGYFFSKAIHDLAQQNLLEIQGKAPLLSFGAVSGIPQGKIISMCDLCKEYLKDPAKGITKRPTLKNYNIIQRAIREIIGDDTPVHTVTREQCKEVRDLIIRLPANALKTSKVISLKDAVILADKKSLPRCAPSTINMHMEKLNALFNYACREGYATWNPANGLKVKDGMKKQLKRLIFDDEQLQKIFNAPLYTGCADDENGYAKIGNAKPRRARFWIPLISLWSGMRLNEICQLLVADIVVRDGVALFSVQLDEGEVSEGQIKKSVKTEAGIRIIPVHPVLQKIGFMDFVKERKNSGNARLFSELSLGAHKDYAHGFSQWYSRFLVSCGAKKARTSFHSFRHTYREAVKEAALPHEATLQLGGWSGKGTDAAYGAVSMKPKTLYDHMSKISYPALDLSHLYVQNT